MITIQDEHTLVIDREHSLTFNKYSLTKIVEFRAGECIVLTNEKTVILVKLETRTFQEFQAPERFSHGVALDTDQLLLWDEMKSESACIFDGRFKEVTFERQNLNDWYIGEATPLGPNYFLTSYHGATGLWKRGGDTMRELFTIRGVDVAHIKHITTRDVVSVIKIDREECLALTSDDAFVHMNFVDGSYMQFDDISVQRAAMLDERSVLMWGCDTKYLYDTMKRQIKPIWTKFAEVEPRFKSVLPLSSHYFFASYDDVGALFEWNRSWNSIREVDSMLLSFDNTRLVRFSASHNTVDIHVGEIDGDELDVVTLVKCRGKMSILSHEIFERR